MARQVNPQGLEDLERMYRASAEVGELLQKSGLPPSEAMAVLLVSAGRLLAREGFSRLTAVTAWDYLSSKASRLFFEWGFGEERAAGHLGRPKDGL